MIKKLLAIMFVVIPVKLLAANVQFADVPPVIDGDPADKAWSLASWVNIDQLILGAQPDEQDFKGRYKLVWTEDHLYMLAEITDDVLHDTHPDPLVNYWDDDTLEIFIDEDASGGDHLYNYNAFAYHIALDNQAIDIGPFNSKADKKAGKRNIRAYPRHIHSQWKRSLEQPNVIHWEVKLSVFGSDYKDDDEKAEPLKLNAGKTLGFMVAYCDSDHGPEREHFIGDVEIEPVNGDRNLGYIDASVFGSIHLVR